MQCDELFLTAPLDFRPKKDNQIDALLFGLINSLNITLPIEHVQDSVYFVGPSIVTFVVNKDLLLVKRGNSAVQFQDWYLSNKAAMTRSLVFNMIKSG